MIQANELRIGNKVIIIPDNVIETVSARMLVFISTAIQNEQPHPFDPIPLTPELLEKCGFKLKSKGTYDYYCKYFNQTDTRGLQQKSKFSLGRNGTEVFINDTWLCGIEYLHQLQNLYFAITGEELEVNL